MFRKICNVESLILLFELWFIPRILRTYIFISTLMYQFYLQMITCNSLILKSSFTLFEMCHGWYKETGELIMSTSCPAINISVQSGVHSDSCPSSQWCHPAISSSVVPFSSCPQSLPASESFPMSQLFTWGSQSTRVSALASFLPKKSQGWSPSEWTGWISLQSKGLSTVFSNTIVQKHQFFGAHSPTLTSIHDHRKNHSLD